MPKSADGTKSLASNNKTKTSSAKKGGDSGTKTASKTPAGGGKMGAKSSQSTKTTAAPSKMGAQSSQKATTNVAAKVKESLASVKQNTVTKLSIPGGLRGLTGPQGQPRVQPTTYGTNYQTAQMMKAAYPKINKIDQTTLTKALDKFSQAIPGEADFKNNPLAGQNIAKVGLNQMIGGMSPQKMLANMDTTGMRPATVGFENPGPNSMGMVTPNSPPSIKASMALQDALFNKGVSPQAVNASNFVAAGTKMVPGVNPAGKPVMGTQFGDDPTWGNKIANANEAGLAKLAGVGGMVADSGQYPSSQPSVNMSMAKETSQVEPSGLFSPPSAPGVHDGQEAVPQMAASPIAPGGGWLSSMADSVKSVVADGYETYTDANQKINAVPGGAKMVATLAKLFGGMGGLGKHPSTFTGKMDGMGGGLPAKPQPTQLAATPSVTPQVPVWLAQMLQMEAA